MRKSAARAAEARGKKKKDADALDLQDAGRRGRNDGDIGSGGRKKKGDRRRRRGKKVGRANFVIACDSPEARGARRAVKIRNCAVKMNNNKYVNNEKQRTERARTRVPSL